MPVTYPLSTLLSPQQVAVIDWVRDGSGSLNLIARAGTGKTYTLMEIAKVIKGRAFMGAFNKAIADEFKERLARQQSHHVKGATIHSAGLSAWKRLAPRADIDGNKVKNIARQKFPWEKRLWPVISSAVSYAKQACFGCGTPLSDEQAWRELIEYYDLQEDMPGGIPLGQFIGFCVETYQESLDTCEVLIDFDDMLLAPLFHKANFDKYDWILVDEAQDTNEARRLVCMAMMREGSRMVAVGDPAQAIYGFAGANSNSMDLIKNALGSIELPLSVTYRCPKAVVDLAQQWVPDFEAHPTAPEGQVNLIQHTQLWEQKWDLANDVVLCRNTRPLVGIADRLRKDHGVPCFVEGMSGKGLMSLAVKWGEDISMEEFEAYLDEYEAREKAKFTAKGKAEKADFIEDRCSILRDMAGKMREGATTADLARRIDMLFNDPGQGKALRLCTIHRSKGREWKRVFLVGRNRYMPSFWAKKDWELKQEENLAYVAVTRAKSELVEVEVPFRVKNKEQEWWEDKQERPGDVYDREEHEERRRRAKARREYPEEVW